MGVVPSTVFQKFDVPLRQLKITLYETRYPGPTEPITIGEYREAVRIAEIVVSWVERLIVAKTETK